MGVGYYLVNFTKKEWLLYSHVPASKARELAGNPVAAAITTWYLLNNLGDWISFISDTYSDWPFPKGSWHDTNSYRDLTDEVISDLIEKGILIDEGKVVYFDDELEVYSRKLRNIWMDS